MPCLTTEEPDRVRSGYSVVPGREIIHLISADRVETAIGDGLSGGLVKQRVTNVAKGRLRNRVVFLLKGEPDNVIDSCRHGLWLE